MTLLDDKIDDLSATTSEVFRYIQSLLPGTTTDTSPVFFATEFGNATWDHTGDVGPAINLAIAAAAAAGGGTIYLPGVTETQPNNYFGLATPIVQANSGVHLVGIGFGEPRATSPNGFFNAKTRLKWTGGTYHGAMLFVGVTGATTGSLYSADVTGIVCDGASAADIGIQIQHVGHSKFEIGGAECVLGNIVFTTTNSTVGPGTQNNDIVAYSRSTSGTATGILFDQGASSNYNCSFNRIKNLYAWFCNGDGIVFAGQDNNLVENIRTARDPASTSGSEVIVANGLYVPPNGVRVNKNQRTSQLHFFHTGASVSVLGLQGGSVWANGTHAGTGVLNPATTTTSATAAQGDLTLSVTSATGIAVGMVAQAAGGNISGVPFNNMVTGVSGTTITFLEPMIDSVASGLSLTFTYGIQATANFKNGGVYTITATDATHFNITPPAGGGTTQTGVVISGGIITFTDVVVPLTGTPTASDTWTFTVAQPSQAVSVSGVDQGNARPKAFFEVGATGRTGYTAQAVDDIFPLGSQVLTGLSLVQSTPASASAAGTKGMIAADTGFVYVCTANNTWKRVAIATW